MIFRRLPRPGRETKRHFESYTREGDFLNQTQFEALYSDKYGDLVRRFGRYHGIQNAEDAAQDALIELLEGKITEADLHKRTRTLVNTTTRQARREHAARVTQVGPSDSRMREQQALRDDVDTTLLHEMEPREYQPGELLGYPFNKLGESTWS